jgi:hypothetical protein
MHVLPASGVLVAPGTLPTPGLLQGSCGSSSRDWGLRQAQVWWRRWLG